MKIWPSLRRWARRLAALAALAAPAHGEDVLYLYIWNSYLSEDTVRRFESQCRCRVNQDYYSDNEEMLAKLDAGATGYDLLVPTGYAVETLLRKNALRPLDRTKLPKLANLKSDFREPWYDPGLRYTVPYATTVTLLGYNATRLAQLGLPTDSWALIFEPRHLEKLKGRVTVLNSQRELMAAAMKYLGHSVQETDPARWDEAKRLILRAKPYWATFSNSTYIKDLALGNIWVAHGYSSDMYRAQQDALEAGRPFAIDFRTPKEGAVLAVDSFVLHQGGRRPDLAHRFIDFMLDGANAADVSNLIGAGNPNAAAMPHIRPEIAGHRGIFPPPEELRRLEMLRDFDPKTRRLLSRMWTEIKVR
ncbi:spermidine/putrescine ABC transporter substrate-binding protein [Accumulibacter sp.]|uniref:polyamine ABC transporter substrate-binding protein n=1 Tax=Accumulibacter sp. TaxID=2053492 RepID=UPI00262C14AC|nr:spermidine/putrescine ABC transporter substrate-binding protein [Accumulibacter sp.]